METFGIVSLLPTAVVIATAVLTHRPVAALLSGVLVGILLLSPGNIIGTLSDITLDVMQDETIGWVIAVCGLMGSLIYILIQTGGASAFARKMAKRANSRSKSLLVTWFLGMVMFIDDYLNAIAIGNSMKKVTDKFKVSRAMLSYVVDSTAAPTCVIVPISTWAVFFELGRRYAHVHFGNTLHVLPVYCIAAGPTGCHRKVSTAGSDETGRGTREAGHARHGTRRTA